MNDCCGLTSSIYPLYLFIYPSIHFRAQRGVTDERRMEDGEVDIHVCLVKAALGGGDAAAGSPLTEFFPPTLTSADSLSPPRPLFHEPLSQAEQVGGGTPLFLVTGSAAALKKTQ